MKISTLKEIKSSTSSTSYEKLAKSSWIFYRDEVAIFLVKEMKNSIWIFFSLSNTKNNLIHLFDKLREVIDFRVGPSFFFHPKEGKLYSGLDAAMKSEEYFFYDILENIGFSNG